MLKNLRRFFRICMVVWVYIQRVKYIGIVTIEEKVTIRCRDGASFEIRAYRDE